MGRSHRDAERRLFEIAEAQQGFFTAKQAKAAGFDANTDSYHVHVGNWIREHRGIYRLALFPLTEHPDLVRWSLWSRNRNEATEGVCNHQTALSLHELFDLNPAKLHMTVPTPSAGTVRWKHNVARRQGYALSHRWCEGLRKEQSDVGLRRI